MANIKSITPFVLTADMDRALAFYEGRLGFECTFRADNYAYVRREGAAIRLIEVGSEIDLGDQRRQNSCYIDVEDVDALYRELEPRLSELAASRLRTPFDQDYGQREFHVADEDATLLMFGAPVAASED
ncbi:bleomycin resistance protein [Oricola sp.]|uniref:bleomycin resistance protein n=1 Tax=Oricola sp. TaxID=1979950 RepID=UPI003BAD2218